MLLKTKKGTTEPSRYHPGHESHGLGVLFPCFIEHRR
jgi:hypothetical protein